MFAGERERYVSWVGGCGGLGLEGGRRDTEDLFAESIEVETHAA